MKYQKGKRYLVQKKSDLSHDPIEVKCVEVATDGRVKFRFFPIDYILWQESDHYHIIKELP